MLESPLTMANSNPSNAFCGGLPLGNTSLHGGEIRGLRQVPANRSI
jgi:hypothetical protein